jgi:hypothetical protein
MAKLRITLDVLHDMPEGLSLEDTDEGHYFRFNEIPAKKFLWGPDIQLVEESKREGDLAEIVNEKATEILASHQKMASCDIQIVEDDFQLP